MAQDSLPLPLALPQDLGTQSQTPPLTLGTLTSCLCTPPPIPPILATS